MEFVQCFINIFSDQEEPPNCLYASVSNEQNQYSKEIKEVVAETIIKWRTVFEEMVDKVFQTHTTKIEFNKVALADQFNVVLEGVFIVSKAINDPSVTARQLTLYKNYLELLFDEGK